MAWLLATKIFYTIGATPRTTLNPFFSPILITFSKKSNRWSRRFAHAIKSPPALLKSLEGIPPFSTSLRRKNSEHFGATTCSVPSMSTWLSSLAVSSWNTCTNPAHILASFSNPTCWTWFPGFHTSNFFALFCKAAKNTSRPWTYIGLLHVVMHYVVGTSSPFLAKLSPAVASIH